MVDMGSGIIGTECTCSHLTVFAIALRNSKQLAPMCHASEVDYAVSSVLFTCCVLISSARKACDLQTLQAVHIVSSSTLCAVASMYLKNSVHHCQARDRVIGWFSDVGFAALCDLVDLVHLPDVDVD